MSLKYVRMKTNGKTTLCAIFCHPKTNAHYAVLVCDITHGGPPEGDELKRLTEKAYVKFAKEE